MFIYEKKLEFPVKIKQTNPKLAGLIISQFGGADCNLLYFFNRLKRKYHVRLFRNTIKIIKTVVKYTL